jgi:hypothetical protein
MFQLFLEAGHRIGETNPVTLAIGLVSIAVQVFFKIKFPHFPVALLWDGGDVVSELTCQVFVNHLVESDQVFIPDIHLPCDRPNSSLKNQPRFRPALNSQDAIPA